MYGALKCVYGSVPRAVASAPRPEACSLQLAVLIQRAFPHTQSQTDLNQAKQHWDTGTATARDCCAADSPVGRLLTRAVAVPILCGSI